MTIEVCDATKDRLQKYIAQVSVVESRMYASTNLTPELVLTSILSTFIFFSISTSARSSRTLPRRTTKTKELLLSAVLILSSSQSIVQFHLFSSMSPLKSKRNSKPKKSKSDRSLPRLWVSCSERRLIQKVMESWQRNIKQLGKLGWQDQTTSQSPFESSGSNAPKEF